MDENKELEIEENEKTSAEESSDEDEKASEPKKKKTFSDYVKDFMDIIESALVTVFFMMMVFTYLLHPVNVKGESMKPTLMDKDRLLMTTVFFDVEYGDILIVDNDMSYMLDENGDPVAVNIDGKQLNECIIKRVIATGGQTVDIRDGKVYVDNKELDEPYIMAGAQTKEMHNTAFKYPITVPEGYYFVLGDNREHSSDSRHADVGLIKKSQINGKALVRYAPKGEFKFLWDTEDESAN